MKSFVKACLLAAVCCILAGIGLLIAVGPSWEKKKVLNGESISFTWEPTDSVSQIDLLVKAGEVIIKEGDCFKLEAVNVDAEDFTSYLNNGMWTISDNRSIRETSVVVPIDIDGLTEEVNAQITLTVPAGFVAEKLNLELGTGEMCVEALTSKQLSVRGGAGSVKLYELKAEEAVCFQIGAGELHAYDFTGCNMTAECGVGELYVKGSVTGESEIHCGIGNVICELSGQEEAYSYSVDCGLGDVKVGKYEHHGIGRHSSHSSHSHHNKIGTDHFQVECGIGSVKISFEED